MRYDESGKKIRVPFKDMAQHERLEVAYDVMRYYPWRIMFADKKPPIQFTRYLWLFCLPYGTRYGNGGIMLPLARRTWWAGYSTTLLRPVKWGAAQESDKDGRHFSTSGQCDDPARALGLFDRVDAAGQNIVLAPLRRINEWPFLAESRDPTDYDLVLEEALPDIIRLSLCPMGIPLWENFEGMDIGL
jgi:hypothetical protein